MTAAEPIVVKVTRYRCPFCSRSWSQRKRAADHVARCWRNPAVRACKTCVYFQPYHWEGEPVPGIPGAVGCTEYPEACGRHEDLREGLRSGCPLWSPAGDET